MVNLKKIQGILSRLRTYLEKLRTLAEHQREDFINDFTKVESAKHLLQVSIESCLNISQHIIASERFRSPENYAESFEILAENRVIPEEFLPTLQKMVRFRNRLVHLYWEVDEATIYDILENELGDFVRFMNYIVKFLDFDNSHNR